MIVDVGFSNSRRAPAPVPQRKHAVAVNLSGEAMRQHERMMEYRHEAARLSADLNSAMTSLHVANSEIDRLNAKIVSLETELKEEREKNANMASQQRQPKQQKKGKKDGATEQDKLSSEA